VFDVVGLVFVHLESEYVLLSLPLHVTVLDCELFEQEFHELVFHAYVTGGGVDDDGTTIGAGADDETPPEVVPDVCFVAGNIGLTAGDRGATAVGPIRLPPLICVRTVRNAVRVIGPTTPYPLEFAVPPQMLISLHWYLCTA